MGERTFTYIMLFGEAPTILGTGGSEVQIGRNQQRCYITEDQFKLIEMIADTAFDENLTKYYFINKLKFKIIPNLEKEKI